LPAQKQIAVGCRQSTFARQTRSQGGAPNLSAVAQVNRIELARKYGAAA